MRPFIFFVCIALLLGADIQAVAQISSDCGTKVDVVFDRSYLDYDIFNEEEREQADRLRMADFLKEQIALSPDGKLIAFVGPYSGIWIVSAEGGEPVLLHEPLYELSSIESPQMSRVLSLTFTSDSQEIIFSRAFFDESKGSIVEIDTTGVGTPLERIYVSSKKNSMYTIESVNIATGEVRVLVDEGRYHNVSRDGRYISYVNFDHMIYLDESQADHNGFPAIYDTVTGETRFLIDSDMFEKGYAWNVISPDNLHVIYSHKDGLVRIPLEGGEIEELPNTDVSLAWDLSYSPDGQFLIYVEAIDVYAGVKYINKMNKIFVYNTETFNTLQFFESDLVEYLKGKLSHDGTKLCYLKVNEEENENGASRINDIYICDFVADNYLNPTFVETEEPSNFTLLKNYPNPFNLSTTIEFTLPRSGFTELVIYNIMGQKIRELLSEDMSTGVHSVVWNGRDENGIPMSSGMFISRLKSRDNVVSYRMMLVK